MVSDRDSGGCCSLRSPYGGGSDGLGRVSKAHRAAVQAWLVSSGMEVLALVEGQENIQVRTGGRPLEIPQDLNSQIKYFNP